MPTRTFTVGFGMISGLLLVAGLAWACTQNAHISTVSPQEGAPGTRVMVAGEQFLEGAVELFFVRNGASSGQLLATTQGPDFTVAVTIPEAPPGMYQILGVAEGGQFTAPGAFQIPQPPGPQRPGGGTGGPNDGPGGGGPGGGSPAPSSPTLTEPAQSTSDLPATTGVQAPARQRPTREPARGTTSSDIVSGDLWSGFEPGSPVVVGPSLIGGRSSSDDRRDPVAAGIVLLGAGALVLMAGVFVAEVSRRRVQSTLR